MGATATSCRACGVPADDLCDACKPAGPLLAHSPPHRLAALNDLGIEHRRFVVLAALRGYKLWSGVRVGEIDLGKELLDWLMANECTITWARWIAEDAVHGEIAWATLAKNDDFDRTLLRSPVWLCMSDAPLTEFMGSLDKDRQKQSALAVRLGSAKVPEKRIEATLAAMTGSMRALARRIAKVGAERPTKGTWIPDHVDLATSTTHRRWPIERIEADGIVVCSICGECLPAEGSCTWCSADPDDIFPTLLNAEDMVANRPLCVYCGIDYTGVAAPVQCPGCASSFIDPLEPPTTPPPESEPL